MVAASRAVRRNLFVALLSAVLVVLAAAMVSAGGDTVRGAGPAVHPAAEITPNSLPRTDGDPQLLDDAEQLAADDAPAGHGPDSVAVAPAGTAPAGVARTGSDPVRDTTARPAVPAPAGPADGRAPPEPVAA